MVVVVNTPPDTVVYAGLASLSVTVPLSVPPERVAPSTFVVTLT